MPVRSPLVVVLATLSLACAAGEPLDGPAAELELAEDETVVGQIFVEVTDESGRPLPADAVWIAVDDFDRHPASCMNDDPQLGCQTWLADFEATDDVTVWAELCGLSFLESVTPVAQPPALSGGAVHVTVVADDTACGQ